LESIWLKNYPQGVPAEIDPNKFPSIVHVFKNTVAQYANRPAVANLRTVLSYQELDEVSDAFAAFLQKILKLQKGDRLAIMLPNLIQYMVVLYGAFKAGLTVVNVNPLYTADELVYQLQDSGAETIVVLANFAKTVQQALGRVKIKNIVVTEVGDAFAAIKSILVNFVVKHIKKMVPAFSIPQAIKYRKAIQQGKHLTLDLIELTGKDLAFLQYTGGTTGVAKGAMLSHRNMVANIEQAFNWMLPFIECGHEIVVTPLPLYHIFSLLANCLVFMRAGSLNLLITNPRDIDGFIKELKSYKFTSMTGVNTLFNALANNKKFKTADFSCLKVVLGGGMAIQRAVADKWQKITGVHLLEAYGLTETCPAVTINPLTLKQYNGSIGLPIPSTQIKILDEDGHEVSIGERGELCIKGPQVMEGYWNMPAETNKVMLPDGWLKTGDIAKVDEEGFVYIVDRKKDMVVVSGFNVYPNEVEDIIALHPGVLEVAVIGMLSEKTGEALKAFVVKKDPSLTKEDIITFCREHLTAYKIPKIYEFRNELPKSNVGKILRRALRNEEKNS